MTWYNYIASFLAGMFLANVVPHFVHGISGDPFPTPFAHPLGKGLSSPTTNVVWALLNLIVGYVLFRVGKVSSGGNLALAIFFAGIAALGMWLSMLFAKIKSADRLPKKMGTNSLFV
jgi:small-conductance mechanosensitive channel